MELEHVQVEDVDGHRLRQDELRPRFGATEDRRALSVPVLGHTNDVAELKLEGIEHPRHGGKDVHAAWQLEDQDDERSVLHIVQLPELVHGSKHGLERSEITERGHNIHWRYVAEDAPVNTGQQHLVCHRCCGNINEDACIICTIDLC